MVVASLFAVTESTESPSTKAEERATEMQPEKGWFFLQNTDKIYFIASYDN